MVRAGGLEPPRHKAADFKSAMSTNSITPACQRLLEPAPLCTAMASRWGGVVQLRPSPLVTVAETPWAAKRPWTASAACSAVLAICERHTMASGPPVPVFPG